MTTYLAPDTPPEVIGRFRAFVEHYRGVSESRLFSGDRIANSFHISWESVVGMTKGAEAPPKEDLDYVAGLVRPFTLSDDVGLSRICSLGKKYCSHAGMGDWFSLVKQHYEAMKIHPCLSGRLAVFDSAGKFMAPQEIFNLYIYGYISHVDLEKRARIEAFHSLEFVPRSAFISYCVELIRGPLFMVNGMLRNMLGETEPSPQIFSGPDPEKFRQLERIIEEARTFPTIKSRDVPTSIGAAFELQIKTEWHPPRITIIPRPPRTPNE